MTGDDVRAITNQLANPPFVHALAHVEGAHLEPGVKVFQFASVIRGAWIGRETVIGPCAALDGVKIGARCRVSYGVHIGPGFDVGDDVFLGPGVVLCNDAWPRASKDGFDADALKHRFAVVVGDGASLGAGVIVTPGVRIGACAMIAAQAVVTRDVPDGWLVKRDGSMEEIVDESDRRARRMRYVMDFDQGVIIDRGPDISSIGDPEELAAIRRGLAQ